MTQVHAKRYSKALDVADKLLGVSVVRFQAAVEEVRVCQRHGFYLTHGGRYERTEGGGEGCVCVLTILMP